MKKKSKYSIEEIKEKFNRCKNIKLEDALNYSENELYEMYLPRISEIKNIFIQ